MVENAVVKKYFITAADGKQYSTKHYNLQMIIAVGFKVNNDRAVRFRKCQRINLPEFQKGWKLFRSKIADWQEAYMDRLNKEYIELLSGEENPFRPANGVFE